LPSEDRSLGDGLIVNLIPDSRWFSKASSHVIPRDRLTSDRFWAEGCGRSARH